MVSHHFSFPMPAWKCGDFDGDGFDDLLVAADGGRGVHIWLPSASGALRLAGVRAVPVPSRL